MPSYIPNMQDVQAHWDRWVVWGSSLTEDVIRHIETFPQQFERFHVRHIGPSTTRAHQVPAATSNVAAGTSRLLRSTSAAILHKILLGSALGAAVSVLAAGLVLYISRPPRSKQRPGNCVAWSHTWAPDFAARESLTFVILAWGQQGDAVEQTLTLALELKSVGHRVRVCLRQEHVDLAKRAGLSEDELVPVTVGAAVDAKLVDARGRIHALFPSLTHYYSAVTAHVFAALWSATDGADVLIGQISPLVSQVAYLVAKKRRMPFFYAAHEPLLLPSSRVHMWSHVPGEMALLRYQLLSFSLAATARPALVPVYRQLGLRRPMLAQTLPMPDFWSIPVLVSFPAVLFPSPSSYNLHHQVGPWTPSDSLTDLTASTPDPDLLGFIRGGSAPVLVSFGMWSAALVPPRSKAAFTSMVYLLLQAAGARAIIDRDLVDAAVPVPSGLDLVYLDGDLSAEKRSWLLAQCRAAIFPGESTHVLASLRAGLPVVVVPQTRLQAPWAEVVKLRGVGAHLKPNELMNQQAWAQALGYVLQGSTRTRASVLAEALVAECKGGVGRTVDAIHDALAALHLTNRASSSSLNAIKRAWAQKRWAEE